MVRRPHIPAGAIGVAAALSLALTACGGDDDTTDEVADAVEEPASPGEQADDGDDGSPASDAATGTSSRPDWTPVWLFLPADLEITIAPNDPTVGESYITGFIDGGDLQLLYDQAVMMVRSGAYIIDDEYEGPGSGFSLETEVPGKGFDATHSSDGSAASFSVYQVDAQRVQWNILFTGLPQS